MTAQKNVFVEAAASTTTSKPDVSAQSKNEIDFQAKIKWPDLIVQLFIHLGCLYGLWLVLTSAKLLTSLWALFTVYTSGFGITAGAHRLWSHRAYKAKWPLRLLLVFLFTITGQRHVHAWALDHRVHHKYSETDADPHNAHRGFWFSHVGWLVLTPHPDVVAKRNAVDMSDLESDPIIMWQKRLYIPLFALLVIALPVGVPCYFWGETLWNSFWLNFNGRFCVTLNIAFFVNSIAHMWGNKPYDKAISPVENLAVSLAALGEGWHNYHHVFPWDYKTSELALKTYISVLRWCCTHVVMEPCMASLGRVYTKRSGLIFLGSKYNPTTHFIDFFAKIGWAYDRKSVSSGMVARRAQRSGDGSHIWGYGDTDIAADDAEELEMMNEEINGNHEKLT